MPCRCCGRWVWNPIWRYQAADWWTTECHPSCEAFELISRLRALCDVWDTQSSWTTDEELQDLIQLAERAAARHEDDRALLDP